MHHESSQRLLLCMTLLAGLWIVVYWSWGPSGITPTVSFDDRPAEGDAGVVTEPPAESDSPRVTGGGLLDQLQGTGEGLRVQPPEFREYTVRAGESLEDISERVYGTRSFWNAIAQANPLRDAEGLRAGDVIRVPMDPQNIQGVVVTEQGERIKPPPPATPEFVEYLVKSGDSLSEISQRYYGTARHARLIFESNRDSLSSMDDLKLGQTLRLPAAPTPEE